MVSRGLALSVIVPARDAAADLPELVRCLERQTLRRDRFEVLIADDGSRDGSTSGLATGDGWLRVLPGPPTNPYAARNRAVAEAAGPVLAFCDADCRPEPTWLERGLQASRTSEVVAGAVLFLAPARRTVWALVDAETFLDQERAVRAGRAVTANLFVPRRLFDAHGGFDGTLANGGDHEFVSRCVRGGAQLAYAPDAIVWHPTRSAPRDFLGKVWTVNRRHGIRQARQGLRPAGARATGWLPLLAPVRRRLAAGRPLGLDTQRLGASGIEASVPERLRALPAIYLVVPYLGSLAQLVGWLQGRRDASRAEPRPAVPTLPEARP